MGMYYHHGIDCGDGSVIHYSGEPAQKASASIERTTLDDFAGGGVVEVVYYERSYDPDEVIARAEEMLGEEGYNLVTNNCEHFAAWCKTGEKHSKQIDRMGLVGTTGTAAITSASRLAPLADLLGVVNVGFGLSSWRASSARFPRSLEQQE